MFENIVGSIISGLVVAFILEIWNRYHQKKVLNHENVNLAKNHQLNSPSESKVSEESPFKQVDSFLKIILRLFFAPVIALIPSIMFYGMLMDFGVIPAITSSERWLLAIFSLITIFIWVLIKRKGPLKSNV